MFLKIIRFLYRFIFLFFYTLKFFSSTIYSACDARDGLAKAAYRKIFDWLLLTLNAANKPDENVSHGVKTHHIGILDIFGFEQVDEGNGFEQFCINFANETLQLFSNQHIFQLEKREHEKEDIPWRDIEFSNNEA